MKICNRRVFLIVLDSVGIGALPDAAAYGDEGAHTLKHTAEAAGLNVPNLCALGLGNIRGANLPFRAGHPTGRWGRAAEQSPGKDTTTGHWEIAGLPLQSPFPTYPHGFPDDLIGVFSRTVGRGVLGNKPASGTEILNELGAERRSQIGHGDRSEKIRTYNGPQDRVTDHRIGWSGSYQSVLIDGDLGPLTEALIAADRAARLAAAAQ